MSEMSMLEAFGGYQLKPARRSRSALAPEGFLVICCWYAGFRKPQGDTMLYEEDLAGQSDEGSGTLRRHLAAALANGSEVRLVVAVAIAAKAQTHDTAGSPARSTYYARKDLIGRVSAFDGEKFSVEFRRTPTPESTVEPRKGKSKRMNA